MSTLATFSRHSAQLMDQPGRPDFAAGLIALFKDLVAVDDATILYYPDRRLPRVEYFELPGGRDESSLRQFVRGPYLLDPYYQAAVAQRFGVFQLRDLAPQGFRDSEYYRGWYRNCGYTDECGYLVRLRGSGFVNIALGKTRPRARFSSGEVTLLRDIEDTVAGLCRRHWLPSEEDSGGVNLRARMDSALEAFGSSLLTERERQVINLVLHGHSTKTLADKLSISTETVKLHRKHAYAKLEVRSQAELFHLFLDSLVSAEDYRGGDTLEAYLKPPPRP